MWGLFLHFLLYLVYPPSHIFSSFVIIYLTPLNHHRSLLTSHPTHTHTPTPTHPHPHLHSQLAKHENPSLTASAIAKQRQALFKVSSPVMTKPKPAPAPTPAPAEEKKSETKEEGKGEGKSEGKEGGDDKVGAEGKDGSVPMDVLVSPMSGARIVVIVW